MNINEKTRKALLRFQQNEITESLLYTQLAAIEKDPSNKEVLLQIANDEKGHYTILKKYTGQEISPNKLRVTKYYWLARILGITFAIKLMEGSEESAKNDYASYDEYPDLQQIARDEDEHEHHHHDGECSCGCGHHHHDHEGHHHADEVFTSWGKETIHTYTKDEVSAILKTLEEDGSYGNVLRAKGMVAGADGEWIYFDMVPEEYEVRTGTPQITGKICVIGSKMAEDKIAEIFGVNE